MGVPSADNILDLLQSIVGVDAAKCVWDQVELAKLVPAASSAVFDGGASLGVYLGGVAAGCGLQSAGELPGKVQAAFGGGAPEIKPHVRIARELEAAGWQPVSRSDLATWAQGNASRWRPALERYDQWLAQRIVSNVGPYYLHLSPQGWLVLHGVPAGQAVPMEVVGPADASNRPGVVSSTRAAMAGALIDQAAGWPAPAIKAALPPGVKKFLGVCTNQAGDVVDCETGAIRVAARNLPDASAAGASSWSTGELVLIAVAGVVVVAIVVALVKD